MRQVSPHPALLLRQLWLLAAFAGVFAARYPWPGLTGLLLLVLLQQRRIFGLGRRFAVSFLAVLLLCFGLGAAWTAWRSAPPPTLPPWAREASGPSAQHLLLEDDLARLKARPERIGQVADNRLPDNGGGPERDGVYAKGLLLRARVEAAEGRPDRTLRLILRDLRPLDGSAPPWPGKLAFTWYLPLTPEGERTLPPDTPAYLRREIGGSRLAARPLPGETVELRLRPRRVHGLKNPGLWDIEPYWTDRGVGLRAWEQGGRAELRGLGGSGPVFAAAAAREKLRQGVLAALPKESGSGPESGALRSGAALLPALLFGDKFLLDGREAELFARSTLAHSLALSGLHLGYAAALGYAAVFLLYRLRPSLALRLPRRKAAVVGGAVPALAYLWLGGAPPSLLRSALMLAFVGWALFRERPPVLADALIWAVAAILVWNPLAAFDLRLQLSALCIAALAWAQPLFSLLSRRLRGPGFGRGLLRGGALLLLSSLVIQIVLAPLLVRTFGLYGLAMPLNLLWLPVLGFAVMPCALLGLLAVALQLGGPAAFFFYLACLPCEALLELLRGLDAAGGLPALLLPRPHWVSMFGFWFLLLSIPWDKMSRGVASTTPLSGLLRTFSARGSGENDSPRRVRVGAPRGVWGGGPIKVIIGLLLLAGPLLWPEPSGVRLSLLDVGQGQAVLLEWGGKRLLVDGGGGNNPRFDVGREVVAAELARNRFPRLDYMLATHLDTDHAGGLIFPLRHLPVGYYADNGERAAGRPAGVITDLLARRGLERRVLRSGDVLELGGGLALEVLHPSLPRREAPADGNRDSLALRLVWRHGGPGVGDGRALALVCGDVDKSTLQSMLKRWGPEGLAAEVLVLPHHGAASSLSPAFYRAVAPRLALASSGYGNYWNFPSPAVKNALLAAEIPLLGTALQGRISLCWPDPSAAMRVSTARSGELAWE